MKEEKFFDYEHKPGELVLRFRRPKADVLPQGASEHFRASVKEMLLAMRAFLDLAIEQVEKPEAAKGKKRAKIEVKG